MELILVGFGGMLGSIARFALGRFITKKAKRQFLVGTFIINASGAFLLGLVSRLGIGYGLNLLVAYGFLGAFTTFSTFMFEGVNLFKQNSIIKAAAYIMVSLFFGIISFIVGMKAGNL